MSLKSSEVRFKRAGMVVKEEDREIAKMRSLF